MDRFTSSRVEIATGISKQLQHTSPIYTSKSYLVDYLRILNNYATLRFSFENSGGPGMSRPLECLHLLLVRNHHQDVLLSPAFESSSSLVFLSTLVARQTPVIMFLSDLASATVTINSAEGKPQSISGSLSLPAMIPSDAGLKSRYLLQSYHIIP
jgi:hypothetical protein